MAPRDVGSGHCDSGVQLDLGIWEVFSNLNGSVSGHGGRGLMVRLDVGRLFQPC